MSIVVGFKCDGSDPAKPGSSEPCQTVVTTVESGSCYIAATDKAKDLERRLEQQGWKFLGGYCYCPNHKL